MSIRHILRQFGKKILEISFQNSIIFSQTKCFEGVSPAGGGGDTLFRQTIPLTGIKHGIIHLLKKGRTKMAKENAEKFEKLLISDEKLQAKLRAAMDAYTGDRRDEKAVFDAVVIPLAEEAGLPFTFEEAREYAGRDREIPLEEGDKAAGGDDASYDPALATSGVCFAIGISPDPPDADSCFDDEVGAGACAYVGVGILMW
jgi:hypothetical protein